MSVQSPNKSAYITLCCALAYVLILYIGFSFGQRYERNTIQGIAVTHDSVKLRHDPSKVHEVNVNAGTLFTIKVLPNERIKSFYAEDAMLWQFDFESGGVDKPGTILVKTNISQAKSNRLVIGTNKRQYNLVIHRKKTSDVMHIEYVH